MCRACVQSSNSRLVVCWCLRGGSMLYACACVRCGLFNIWCVVLPWICFGFGAGKMHAPLRSRARSRAVSVFKNQAAHHLMIIFSFSSSCDFNSAICLFFSSMVFFKLEISCDSGEGPPGEVMALPWPLLANRWLASCSSIYWYKHPHLQTINT